MGECDKRKSHISSKFHMIYIISFSILHDNKSKASSKTIPLHSAI